MKTLPSDPFLRGYIVAALFTTDPCPPGGVDYQDSGRAEEMMPRVPDSFIAKAEFDCAYFQKLEEVALEQASSLGHGAESSGADLWYSRNGHGTGFWDRDLGDTGDRLHEAAEAMDEHHLELGGWWRVEYQCPKCHAEWTHDEDADAEDFGESQCEECEIPVLSLNREQGEHLTDIEEPEEPMNSKHTPGPWWKEDEFIFADGKRIADCTPNEHDDMPMSDQELEANARLIASSPRLLAAAEKVLANWDSGDLAGAVRELAAVVDSIKEEA